MGQVRLSIIDLSPGGHQPMTAPGVEAWLVFNGEIYNYRELRHQLEQEGVQFHTHSDTEVILQMYQKHGVGMLPYLNGIFSIALWDLRKQTLFCARDPLGTKPFYWTQAEERFLFASEIKVLLPLPGVARRLNPSSLPFHLSYLYCPGRDTAFDGVHKLEPGHFMQVDRNGSILEQHRFFEWEYSENTSVPEPERIREAGNEILQAVKRQLVADVPVGIFLSGGLDSSAIAAAYRLAEPDRPIDAFCSVMDGGDGFVQDWPYAKRVAEHLNITLHPLPLAQFDLDQWSRIIWHQEEPQGDATVYQVDQITRMAHERGYKVMLSGLGGDDLFGGYKRHVLTRYENYRTAIPRGVRSAASAFGRHLPSRPPMIRRFRKALTGFELLTDERIASLFEWMSKEEVASLLGVPVDDRPRNYFASAIGSLGKNVHPVNRALFMETLGFLPDQNLNYIDKLSMAHGIETRVPLLDLKLVAYANQLPIADKVRWGTAKWILKKAMEPYLPNEIIYRPKTGFGPPLRSWMAGSMRKEMDARFSKAHIKSRGWFDADAVERVWQDTLAGRRDGSYTLWAILTLDMWAECFGIST